MSYFKVVATVHKVNNPQSMTPGKPSHVALPCRMYKEGDKIVIEDNQINMAETTGALCLSLVSSMIPVLKALQRAPKPIIEGGEEKHDSTQGVTWFTCPDAERPVILKIQRIPQQVPGWIKAEELAKKNPGTSIHLHTPNLTDEARGDHDNLWNQIIQV
jgi:uncharacterized repeat protein (TIGR04076 family)